MSLIALLTSLRRDPEFMANVMRWQTLPAQPANWTPIPGQLHPGLVAALRQRGIEQLYSHQAQAIDAALNGQNVVVTTPTASGKTLCYNLPVLDTLLRDTKARALYLFPTKALAHDQLDEIRDWKFLISNLFVSAYDGDTPSSDRPQIRKNARIVLTNPDMLHTGILPYHTQWREFFSGLRIIVIDEMHTYRGVFGSHVANVLRRLQRICNFYGSQPHFIFTSATIANPAQLAERLIEQPVTLVDQNGAPRGEKQIIVYNPPLLDAETGARRSVLLETDALAARTIRNEVQTIVFGRSRRTVELLLTYLREQMTITDSNSNTNPQSLIRGYRGGYLPEERRAIEAGLRSGEVRGVVATNALELGIDIGQLQAAVLCGYPGSIASIWQQMGRAGRTQEGALAILVTSGLPIDQYLARHPEFLFERSPEQALINPDNLMLLVDQMRCAAFELPFSTSDGFGHSQFSSDVFDLLLEQGDIKRFGTRLMWSGAGYPSRQISLRSAGSEQVVIQMGRRSGEMGRWGDEEKQGEQPQARIIGEISVESAPFEVHDGAIYMHEGETYRVDQLDLEQRIASVTPVNVDFYTATDGELEVEVLQVHAERHSETVGQWISKSVDRELAIPNPQSAIRNSISHGDLRVISQITGYRRIRRQTHEVIDTFPLDYPPSTLETAGYWFSISEETQRILAEQGAWFDSINDYGPNWQEQRQKARKRDGFRCTQCGAKEPPEREHDVHHVRPFRTFGYVRGVNDFYLQANVLNNLLLVCRNCHRRIESGVRTRGALDGLGYAINNIAPIYLMCDPGDIGVYVERAEMRNAEVGMRNLQASTDENSIPTSAIRNPQSTLPTIYIYERIPAGLGFALRLYEMHEDMLRAAHELITHCPCHNGCPACIGPVVDHPLAQLETKHLTTALLEVLLTGQVEDTRVASEDVEF
ncbi:MAG: DEAD/DEAH box helicase [Caldilineaceae bacterium]